MKIFSYLLGIMLTLVLYSVNAEQDMIRCKEVITIDWLIKENSGFSQENITFMCDKIIDGNWLVCVEGQKQTGQTFSDALNICSDIEN